MQTLEAGVWIWKANLSAGRTMSGKNKVSRRVAEREAEQAINKALAPKKTRLKRP